MHSQLCVNLEAQALEIELSFPVLVLCPRFYVCDCVFLHSFTEEIIVHTVIQLNN